MHSFRAPAACCLLLGLGACLSSAQVVINEASFVSSDRVLQFDGVGRPHLGCYTDWHAEGFNDSFWNSGPGPFGFGYPSQGTNLAAVMQNRFSTVYLRREFSVTPGQAASASPLELVIDYDDGFVAYVNGVEVARRNAGPTPAFVFHDQTAFNRKPAAGAETIALGVANARLHEGINVLAIHVLNDAVTQSPGYVGHQPGSGQLRCDASLRIGGGVPEVLVSAADSWRYFVGRHAPSGGLLDPTDFSSGLAPGPEWTQIGYADGTWVVAPGALGFDTAVDYVPQLGTNLLSMRTSRLSVYMRRAFELTAAELDGITSLNLTVDWDDGYVLYLNGQEISRNNLGGSPGAFVGFNQPAVLHNASRDGGGNNPAAIVSVGVTKSQLKVGTNVIAAQLHNNDVGSSDLLLDVQFSATGTTPLTFVTKGSAWRYVIPSSEIASPVPEGAVLKPEFHDWIELKNTGAAPVDLNGWSLTDERDTPLKWVFQSGVQIPAGGYLVVACSGRDIAAPGPGGYLHANFSLDADGEYVALSNPGGDVVSELGNVPSQDSFHTWGLDPTNGGYRFLDRATPGADNAGSSAVGRAEDVEIDRETGYYDGSLTIGLSSPTPGAVIRFTTDGSEPTESNGSIYTGAFDLSSHVDHPPGNILREFWSGVPGANVADFAFDTPPSSSTLINPVEVSFNAGENVATRLRGFVKPAVTAQYTFWVAGNDSAELWLSPTASPADRQRIAFTTQPTFLQGWSVSPTQQAAPVLLQAGGRYYIEVLHKDATGSDHVSVAWERPGFPRTLLGGAFVSPASIPGGPSGPPTAVSLRARALAPDLLPSGVQTRTYALNYDARLRTIPAVFLTGDDGRSFYPPNGIFSIVGGSFVGSNWTPTNPANDYDFCLMHGEAFERPVVFEVLNPGNQLAVRHTVGARFAASPWSRPQQQLNNVQTATWNSGWQNKPQINLYFRGDFGTARLEKEGFIPASDLDEWDTLRLRAGKNDPYNPFIVDELMRRCFRKMGNPSPVGFFANLFVNGRLKSYFNPTERPRESFFQEYFDTDNEWDVQVIYEWESGDGAAHGQMLAFFQQNDLSVPANYQTALTLWDVDNVADYFLINAWGSTQDWPHNNFAFARERAPGAKWRFSMWDAEGAFGVFGQSTAHNTFDANLLVPENGARSPTLTGDSLASRLVFRRFYQSPEFRLRFADRIQKHFFAPGGSLSATSRQAEFTALRNSMAPVIQATFNQSLNETFWNNWGGTTRLNTFLGQARTLGMWPATQAPLLTPGGGTISAGQMVTVSHANTSGTIHVTTDGSDPRAVGGDVHGAPYAGPIAVATPMRIKARVLSGTEWSPLTEGDFAPPPPAIMITEIHYNPAGPDESLEFIELMNVGGGSAAMAGAHFTDGIEYVFGNSVLAAGERIVLVADAAAFAAAYPGVSIGGEFAGQLRNSGDTLTLRDLTGAILCSVTYGDSSLPGWPDDADGEGHSLVLKRPAAGVPVNDPSVWRASAAPGGNPGSSDAVTFPGPDPSADGDGDGFSALVEYALASDDGNAGSIPVLTLGDDGAGSTTLSALHRCGADDVDVEAIESADLSGWEPAEFLSDLAAGGELASRTWRCQTAGGNRAFVRVRVTLVP